MDVFGSSGARGILSDGVTPVLLERIARAAVAHWEADRVAVGRDGRVTGAAMAAAASAGAAAAGADVARLGVLPTPATQAYAEHEGTPALMVTASHNPPPANGIKLINADGGDIHIDDYTAIENALESVEYAEWNAFGDIEPTSGAVRTYLDELSTALATDHIGDANLSVVIDPANGPGALITPKLCRELGCSVRTINADLDGHFPGRPPEPVPEHLADLSAMVAETDADLGIAHDGDADRAVFIDETGVPIGASASFAALAAATVESGDTVISGVSASRQLEAVLDDAGGTLELTAVGAARILSRVRELIEEGTSVPIAGEGNGGIIFPNHRLARDGPYTAGRFLELVAERPASAIVADLPSYTFRRRDVAYEAASQQAKLDAAERWLRERDGDLTTVDGIRLDREDEWVLVRTSGTEPLIRIYAEARSAERAEALVNEVAAVVGDA